MLTRPKTSNIHTLSHWNLCFCSHEFSAILIYLFPHLLWSACVHLHLFVRVCQSLRCIFSTFTWNVVDGVHKRNTTNGEIDKSKIAEHSWEQKHRLQWDKASLIRKEENWKIRKLKESAFIHCTGHVISQPSIDISPIWLSIIRPKIKRKKLWRET